VVQYHFSSVESISSLPVWWRNESKPED